MLVNVLGFFNVKLLFKKIIRSRNNLIFIKFRSYYENPYP